MLNFQNLHFRASLIFILLVVTIEIIVVTSISLYIIEDAFVKTLQFQKLNEKST